MRLKVIAALGGISWECRVLDHEELCIDKGHGSISGLHHHQLADSWGHSLSTCFTCEGEVEGRDSIQDQLSSGGPGVVVEEINDVGESWGLVYSFAAEAGDAA